MKILIILSNTFIFSSIRYVYPASVNPDPLEDKFACKEEHNKLVESVDELNLPYSERREHTSIRPDSSIDKSSFSCPLHHTYGGNTYNIESDNNGDEVADTSFISSTESSDIQKEERSKLEITKGEDGYCTCKNDTSYDFKTEAKPDDENHGHAGELAKLHSEHNDFEFFFSNSGTHIEENIASYLNLPSDTPINTLPETETENSYEDKKSGIIDDNEINESKVSNEGEIYAKSTFSINMPSGIIENVDEEKIQVNGARGTIITSEEEKFESPGNNCNLSMEKNLKYVILDNVNDEANGLNTTRDEEGVNSQNIDTQENRELCNVEEEEEKTSFVSNIDTNVYKDTNMKTVLLEEYMENSNINPNDGKESCINVIAAENMNELDAVKIDDHGSKVSSINTITTENINELGAKNFDTHEGKESNINIIVAENVSELDVKNVDTYESKEFDINTFLTEDKVGMDDSNTISNESKEFYMNKVLTEDKVGMDDSNTISNEGKGSNINIIVAENVYEVDAKKVDTYESKEFDINTFLTEEKGIEHSNINTNENKGSSINTVSTEEKGIEHSNINTNENKGSSINTVSTEEKGIEHSNIDTNECKEASINLIVGENASELNTLKIEKTREFKEEETENSKTRSVLMSDNTNKGNCSEAVNETELLELQKFLLGNPINQSFLNETSTSSNSNTEKCFTDEKPGNVDSNFGSNMNVRESDSFYNFGQTYTFIHYNGGKQQRDKLTNEYLSACNDLKKTTNHDKRAFDMYSEIRNSKREIEHTEMGKKLSDCSVEKKSSEQVKEKIEKKATGINFYDYEVLNQIYNQSPLNFTIFGRIFSDLKDILTSCSNTEEIEGKISSFVISSRRYKLFQNSFDENKSTENIQGIVDAYHSSINQFVQNVDGFDEKNLALKIKDIMDNFLSNSE